MKDEILKNFRDNHKNFELFGNKIKTIITEILETHELFVHQISFRIKEFDSLAKKIESKQGKYNSLDQVTDIVGIRIITYLESDVDRVANVLDDEFVIDSANSIDKRNQFTDKFGYRSLHKVISLNDNRLYQTENKKYNSLKAEIQIRSILQHSWAEIEHDLGYKGTVAIPEQIKRNFFRLSALLEIADAEFDRLKIEIEKYKENIEQAIIVSPDNVDLNQDSIYSLLKTNKTFAKIREIISKNTGCTFSTIFHEVSTDIDRLKFIFEFNNIGQLERSIEENSKIFQLFVDSLTKDYRYTELNPTLPLFYFQHFLAAMTKDENYIINYFKIGRIRGGIEAAKRYIEIINNVISKIQ